MAVKRSRSKKTTKKKTSPKIKKRPSSTHQVIDDMLVKISPTLQSKINQLMGVLENSKEGRLGDLTFLAGKILQRAQDVSKSLKSLRKRKS